MKSLSNIDLKMLLEKLERKMKIKFPKEIISTSFVENTLHIRFTYPKTRETYVESPPLKTPVFLFRDEETREITAIEILDIDEALIELSRE